MIQRIWTGCAKGEVKEARAPGSRQPKRMGEDLPKECPRCEGLAEVQCGTCKGETMGLCPTCRGEGAVA